MNLPHNAFAQDKDGHVLTRLWADYQKAEDQDRPKDQVRILEQIKQEATDRRLPWDFYDAAVKYMDVRANINWKEREDAYNQTVEEIGRFGEPVVYFHFNQTAQRYHITNAHYTQRLPELLAYVQEHKEQMERAHNARFYEADDALGRLDYREALLHLLRNDYEYAMWSLLCTGYGQDWKQQIAQVIKEQGYPFDALAEFTLIRQDNSADAAYEKYAADHAGQAVALMARDHLLTSRFEKLRAHDGKQEDFLQLARDCETLQADRKKFSGNERLIANCCTAADGILKELNEKSIEASIHDRTVSIVLRNLPQVNLTITKRYGDDKKPVFERLVANTRRSFYVEDELTFELPDIDDGSYVLRCTEGKTEFETNYEKYTLSLAVKRDYDGFGVYVADYLTGKPVSRCDLLLLNGDKQVEVIKDFAIDGFTYLPARIASLLEADTHSRYSVQATLRENGLKHSSQRQRFHVTERETVSTDNPARHRAYILTDRSAFIPGETVHFKVLLYEGTYEFKTRPAGIRLHARLLDPTGKLVDESDLVTGEFGSAAGSFVLKKADRGGMYQIVVDEDKETAGSTRVRVDEFVLPTFSLDWTPDRRIYFEQDEVTVRGNVKSYSGHSLGTATARYEIEFHGGDRIEAPLELSGSGDFEIRFTAPATQYSRGYATVTVTITDSTGETLSFNKLVEIQGYLPLYIDIQNQAAGQFRSVSQRGNLIIGDDFIKARFRPGREGLTHPTLKITYKVMRGTSTVCSGEAPADQPVDLSLAGLPSGLYTVEATVTARSDGGKEYTETVTEQIMKCADSDTVLDADVRCFFKKLADDGKSIALQIGATTGPVWAVAELYGDGNRLLDKRMVRLSGVRGKAGSLETVRFERKRGYPESLTLRVFWFRDGTSYDYSVSSFKAEEPFKLPLGFSRFLDTTLPHTDYQFTIRTGAGTEVAATIFDKSTETIQPNVWRTISPQSRRLPSVHFSEAPGKDETTYHVYHLTTRAMAGRAPGMAANDDEFLAEGAVMDAMVDEESVVVGYGVSKNANATESVAAVAAEPTVIRSDFANTVAWEPFLRSDENGEVTFRFTTADKLSTYYVQLFAHDKDFHNATLRQEMVVTLPVKVAIVQPQYLYEGDRYVAHVTVANSLDVPVAGRIRVSFLAGKDHKSAPVISTEDKAVTVPAGGNADFSCTLSAPAVADLGLLVSFVADNADYGSDAVFVTLPVKPAVQTITEAHSALMLSWMDREAILTALRGQFVNVPGSAASLREISILDMIREAVPEKVLPTSDNLLAQSEALFANYLIDRLPDSQGSAATPEQRAEMCAKILACRNADGGFSWFPEMFSSPVLTSVLLERFAAMGDACPQELAATIPEAVKYLDSAYFNATARPFWCGGISMYQYLHTRSLFPEVAFEPKADAKVMATFKKAVKAYLTPGTKRGLNGQVFDKARRMKTLRALLQSDAGTALARKWGISLFAKRRLTRSLDKDVASLLQYAVQHKSGGYYYPNAVMPWRGLLESELYAHTLICNLLTDCGHSEVAEGIRLWTMVQKETQQWADDPAYIEAIDCVLRGSEETLQTRVLALSATTTLPFRQVKAAGNGFTVSLASYTRDGIHMLQDGDTLHVGDHILATYQIWNEENRSFVRLSMPHPAAFRPVEQRSGRCGGNLLGRLIYSPGLGTFSPQGYRSVLADRTEFWFDVYPEGNTTIVEEFFVTQEGTFQCPVTEIESLYAPHYRANDDGRPAVVVAQ